MLIDLLSSENYITFSIPMTKVFGLEGAVYCSELINIYKKATAKNKLVDKEYIKIDRNYIFNRTTIDIETQLKYDINWAKIGLLEKSKESDDVIKLDLNLLVSMFTGTDVTTLNNLAKKAQIKSPKGIKEAKRTVLCTSLKNNIICSNDELLKSLRDWIDCIFQLPDSYLTKKQVEVFQKTLDSYTNGDLDIALEIVNIAIAHGWKDCSWAINSYEKSKQIHSISVQNKQLNAPRKTKQEKATIKDLNTAILF